jgi:hypothetical protein
MAHVEESASKCGDKIKVIAEKPQPARIFE